MSDANGELLGWARLLESGPLLSAARSFVRWREGAPEPGPAGVRWLCAELEAFAHDVEAPPDDDARFVEGAGALLALLLLERHGGRYRCREDDHEHRIDIGEHGFFDPFGAIDLALDAEAPARSLAASLAEAETEACGRGPIARVRKAFAQTLGAARPDQRVVSSFGLDVELEGGTRVDLRRIAAATESQGPSALMAAAAKLVALLPGGTSVALAWEEAAPTLRPRLVGAPFVASLPHAEALFFHPLGHDVQVALLHCLPGRARYLRTHEVETWIAEGAQPLLRAIENLATDSQGARFAQVEGEGSSLVITRTGDGHDAARILLPTLREVLAEHLPGPLLLAVPHRDALLAAPLAERALLEARAKDAARRAPHAISERLFRLDESGLSPAPG